MTKKQLQALSPSETEILRLVWESRGATVQAICDALPESRRVAYATVQTLLRRLEKKGYVEHKIQGKAHVFHPAARKEEVIKRTVTDFLDRLFGGDVVPLVQYLAEHGRLDAHDIEKLKELIEKK
jgi:predicted transcriptional regulator